MPTPVINIFGSDSFSGASLTKAVVEIPNQFPQVPLDDLFTEDFINTTVAQVDYQNEEVNLVQQRPRGGGKAVKNRSASRGSRFYEVPGRRLEDSVTAKDVQNRRKLGVPDLETAEDVVAERLLSMNLKLQTTRMYLKMQALQGKIVDPDGSTIYDAFTELALTQTSIDMVLGTSTTNLVSKILQLSDTIDENLTGTPSAGKRAYCSPTFFRKFVTHAKIEEAYKFFQSVQNPNRDDVRAGFIHEGIEWINVPHKATVVDAYGGVTTKLYVPDGEAIVAPTGTDLGREFLAPADHLEFANENGAPFYSWSDYKQGEGVLDLFQEYDGLPIWQKPKTLIKLTTSN